MTPEITFNIDGRIVTREEIIPEELKRAKVAMEILGISCKSDDIIEIRKSLVEKKFSLGHEKLKVLLAPQIWKAERLVPLMRVFSFGKVKPCRMEVFAKGISAKEFIEWFEHTNAINDEAHMIAAHPEHYIIDTTPEGRQEIYERTGGSPCVAAFVIDFGDKDDALKQALPGYPYHIAGKAINKNGKKIGGSMHQFQDTEDGLHGILSIDYPKMTPASIMSGHKIHLAIEFSNWIEMAAETRTLEKDPIDPVKKAAVEAVEDFMEKDNE